MWEWFLYVACMVIFAGPLILEALPKIKGGVEDIHKRVNKKRDDDDPDISTLS